MRGFGDERGFLPRAMIAPEIVFVERLKLFADGNDAGAGGVDSESRDLIAGEVGGGEGALHCFREAAKLIFVRLRGVVGILFFAVEGIFGDTRAETAASGVYESDANAKSAEVDACYDGHEWFLWPQGQKL